MSQLYPTAAKHRCQIDCTNHDEVITGLELKSKELYFFWRNYEWLYNRYYSQVNEPKQQVVKQNHDHCQRELDALESQNQKLMRQNKRMKVDLDTCRKQLADDSVSKLEGDYKRQITLLKSKANEYQTINDKLLAENNRLKGSIKSYEEEFEAERTKLVRQNKKSLQTIVDLQQVIDQLRSRSAVQPVRTQEGASPAQMEEFSRKQVTMVTTRIRSLNEEVERIVASQFEGLKDDLDNRLADMLSSLSFRELQSVIISVDQSY